MTSKRVYIDHLRRAEFFTGFSRKDLETISSVSDEVSVPAGYVITEQGQPGYDAFLVLSGTVVVRRNGRKIATLGEGAVLGELALLDDGERTATIVAETECALLVLTRSSFVRVIKDVPKLAQALLVSLAGRLRALDAESVG